MSQYFILDEAPNCDMFPNLEHLDLFGEEASCTLVRVLNKIGTLV